MKIRTSGNIHQSLIIVIYVILGIIVSGNYCYSQKNVYQLSRVNTVKIIDGKHQVLGSGFFLNNRFAVTCFHVIADVQRKDSTYAWKFYDSLKIVTSFGDTVNARCVTPPTRSTPEPLIKDFGVLQLDTLASLSFNPFPLQSVDTLLPIGDMVIYSGYQQHGEIPMTCTGMISGISSDGERMFFQAPVTKQFSGSALFDVKGEVVGIVCLHEELKRMTHVPQFPENVSGTDSTKSAIPLKTMVESFWESHSEGESGFGSARSIRYIQQYLNKR